MTNRTGRAWLGNMIADSAESTSNDQHSIAADTNTTPGAGSETTRLSLVNVEVAFPSQAGRGPMSALTDAE
jgi:hypothetical protein